MKSITVLLGFTLLVTSVSFSQGVADSTRRQQRASQHRGFVDENGDGIDDRGGQRQGRMKQQMDRFIDLDGDGICDGRERGLGFQRGKTDGGVGTGKQSGKKGQGGRR